MEAAVSNKAFGNILEGFCIESGRSPVLATAFANMVVCSCCERHRMDRPRDARDILVVPVTDSPTGHDPGRKVCLCDCRMLSRMIVRAVAEGISDAG